ncbi:serine/threonine-protein kinase [Pyxidicoccus xibeiensis]|uniref:serine/threonine-protein kinase n=1 Tax=Pyxidicoccus xibeiensis TaxID=2906759 RepID=UPI0020A76498|nr:protein kinase [Pyxidicoccus xibeiensis]MCP3138402.1 protein kinase [Pyxidicoccus xibeiensis]
MNERYRLVRPLAVGGMAELFLGVSRSEGFERTVAIKRVLPYLAREPDIARMFLAEARLATQLQHQNIATVYDVGQGPNGLFLVMELVDGWDLGVLLRTATRQGVRFPPHLAAFVLLQVLAGLSHAYRKLHAGRPVIVAHRDVSPSNVLVSREGEVKVTDFGIARFEGPSLTAPGVFKGKEAYSAPEVLQGAPATAASDQFSLGIVFHELLTGHHPFHSLTEPVAVTYAIITREVPRPPHVPAPLADVLLRMLARTPEERFPTPEALSEALARWLAQAGEPATSHALAAFMRELPLPPTLRELAESSDAPAGSPGPVPAPDFGPEYADEPLPGGAALSVSGRVVHRCTRCDQPLSSPHAPCDRCAEELAPPSPVFTPAPTARTPPRAGPTGTTPMSTPRVPPAHPGASTPPRAGAGALPPARPHATAGTTRVAPLLEQSPTRTLAESMEPAPTPFPARSVLQTPAEALELVERAPRPVSDWQEDTLAARGRSRRRLLLALGGLAVLALGAALWAWRGTVSRELLSATGIRLASPVLSVRSQPAGASVWVEGKEVGTTPLVVDNVYPDRVLSVQVRHKGYRTWKGTFRGGQPVDFQVTLDDR